MATLASLPAAGLLYWVGALSAAYVTLRAGYRLVAGLRVWVLGRRALPGPGLGAWAVVTGATDGIGKAYAEELARCGMKIALISRSQEKLDQVASQIRKKSGSCCQYQALHYSLDKQAPLNSFWFLKQQHSLRGGNLANCLHRKAFGELADPSRCPDPSSCSFYLSLGHS
ncbi:very-long-chain 3-oxoacyl-CoA reductase-like isoform X1 [Alligator sinensis]|uniref:Very-long-chain 3-oxoacyl-CoA reductase-like isoform X1 n=1 Tax=Alligator sinensis TaxID=38654 RepID=A0A1U7SC38_ALLSI|nr:very-long-chain 3-oxoacyl-CoA reductase-like isoform X1 [Alligator sinensis]